LSDTYQLDWLYYSARPAAEAGRLAEEEARTAITIDADDPAGHRALATALLMTGKSDAAFECADRALTLNKNSAAGYRIRASALMVMGQYADSRADALVSLRLNPRDPFGAVAIGLLAASHYLEGDYEAAVEIVRRRLHHFPDFPLPRRFLVAALGQLGRREEAAAALGELQMWGPNALNNMALLGAEHYERLLDGLRKAGWQG
jgi:tetratricopeptide (TPR) repeat protein